MTDTLSTSQSDSVRMLENYAGRTVLVTTSDYTSGVDPDFQRNRIGGVFKLQTLRALERRGLIRIVASYWRGATLEISHDIAKRTAK